MFPGDFIARMHDHIEAGRPGDAVKQFMRHVGAPGIAIAVMRLLPVWRKLKGVAHTLPNDMTIIQDESDGEPLRPGRWGSLTAPVLMMAGSKSDEWMRHGARSVADALPNAEYRTIEGQDHMLKAQAIAPVLIEWLAAQQPAAVKLVA